jgi:hypothetical protein
MAYGLGLAIDIAMFLFGGLGGPYPYVWVFFLHSILGALFLHMYIKNLKSEVASLAPKTILYIILLILILPLPMLLASSYN